MSKSIAIITARGGSKRIPKKNIREFCGKPIICYAIEAALKSGMYDTVMVSTDSEEIADIGATNFFGDISLSLEDEVVQSLPNGCTWFMTEEI